MDQAPPIWAPMKGSGDIRGQRSAGVTWGQFIKRIRPPGGEWGSDQGPTGVTRVEPSHGRTGPG